ncbi:MAG: DUF6591 domain-containing protein [Mobilitalea sp.]
MLRKIKFFAIILAVLLIMAGCNLKEKIGESITEGILDKAVGDDVDIDIDGGDISFKGEDGEEINFDDENGLTIEGEDGSVVASGGEYEWPDGQAADYLPEFKGGKITYIFNSETSCMLMIEETKTEDYEDYVKKAIDKGYNVDKTESSAEDMLLYAAKSEEGVSFTAYYVDSEGALTISVDATGKQ